jgi:carbamoyl-phosphate synthase small subunit
VTTGTPSRGSDAYVLLEDGTRFDGDACAATLDGVVTTGEVVFTTGMGGYQESVTDPSFAGQVLTFTTAHVGSYGGSGAAMESDRVWTRGVVMRQAHNAEDAPSAERGWLDWLRDAGVPGITGVDTRALVRHIRSAGAMRGGVFPAAVDEARARERVAAEPPMAGRDLAREVTPPQATVHGDGATRVHAIDTGIKSSIVRQLVARGAQVTLHPCSVTADELLATDADLIFLANGPGDPAALGHIVATVRELVGRRPVWGICLGHQLLCQAVGLGTYKLPFGHRGANHPVKDLTTGRIEITSQNHGFAVTPPGGAARLDTDEAVRWETDFGTAELTHVNLYDGTVEGLRLLDVPASTVQYHPEAGPGPHDARHLFDRFLAAAR